jgi:hypothetical protein
MVQTGRRRPLAISDGPVSICIVMPGLGRPWAGYPRLAGNDPADPVVRADSNRATCFACFIRLRSGIANSFQSEAPARSWAPICTEVPCDYGNSIASGCRTSHPNLWFHLQTVSRNPIQPSIRETSLSETMRHKFGNLTDRSKPLCLRSGRRAIIVDCSRTLSGQWAIERRKAK